MKAYIDDFIGFTDSEARAWILLQGLFRTADVLGAEFSDKKLRRPAPVNKALGFIFDLPQQAVHIPEEKIGEGATAHSCNVECGHSHAVRN